MQPPRESICAGSFDLFVAELSIHMRGDEARRSGSGVEPLLEDDAARTTVLLIAEREHHLTRLPDPRSPVDACRSAVMASTL